MFHHMQLLVEILQKYLKYRFPLEIRESLMKMDFSLLTKEYIEQNIDFFYSYISVESKWFTNLCKWKYDKCTNYIWNSPRSNKDGSSGENTTEKIINIFWCESLCDSSASWSIRPGFRDISNKAWLWFEYYEIGTRFIWYNKSGIIGVEVGF